MAQVRLEIIDNSRVIANWLRCFLHTLVPFMVFRTGQWPVHYGNQSFLLTDVCVLTIHGFIMEAFFVIAGMIFLIEFEKKGLMVYVQNRVRKIVLPFILGLVILIPYILILFPISEALSSGNFHWQMKEFAEVALQNYKQNLFVLGHLWFLYYLIIYYLIMLLIFKIIPDYQERILNISRRVSWIVPIIMFLCTLFSDYWYVINPLTTHIEWTSFIYFLTFFILGICLRHKFDKLQFLIDYKKRIILFFLILTLINGSLQNFYRKPSAEYQDIIRYGAYLSSVLQSCFGLMLIYVLSFKNPWKNSSFFKFQVKATYWTYLIHLPIVMGLHVLFFNIELPMLIKFLIIYPVSMILANFSYVLIGRKILHL